MYSILKLYKNWYLHPTPSLSYFDWHAYGLVVGSEYRKRVAVALLAGPKTPKQIAELTGLKLSHVSLTLSELQKAEIAECLTPELRKGRLYQLTTTGRDITQRIKAA
jgi:ArsR family transcriptional regulator, cadmium/lead-responsive transcriptional repressor